MELKKLNEEGEYPQEALLTFHISDPSAWGDGIAVGFADCRRGDERRNKTNAAPRRASGSGPALPSAGPGWRCGFLPCKGRMIQSELEKKTKGTTMSKPEPYPKDAKMFNNNPIHH